MRIGKWTFRSRTSSSGRACRAALRAADLPRRWRVRDRSGAFRLAQVAADEVAVGDARPARRLGAAAVEGVLAAVGEAAAGETRPMSGGTWPGITASSRAALAGRRQRGEQLARVRMLRRAEESIARRDLDDLPGVHDRDAVRHAGDDAEIVGDQQDRHPALRLQRAQEVEHLRLDGDVERGRRLVGDEQLGLAGERERDHHPLLQPAGELERIVVDAARAVGDADRVEQLDRPRARRGAADAGVCRVEHLARSASRP